MPSQYRPTAVVTGASAGFGEATARRLAAAGFRVFVGARRLDRLEKLATEIDGVAIGLDVTSDESVKAFASQVDECQVLVNNAGGALGKDTIADADDEKWRWMYDVNVMGTMRMTRALLPLLVASGNGRIVNLGSVAGVQPYPGGAGYIATKAALRSITQVLRMEMLGQPVRVTEVAPGAADTEFSLVRFDGDVEQAAAVYEGWTPLTADDVADCITFAATRPAHVNIDYLAVMARDQATATMINRQT